MPESMRQFKAGIFQALGHPTRVAIAEYLSHGELSVGQLCDKVGVEQANASQHLAVLRNKHIVETRKDGNQIFYRLRDPVLGEVLAKMREYFFAHIGEAMEMLRLEENETKRAGRRPGDEAKPDAEVGRVFAGLRHQDVPR
jgi:ArsR family transcriptional regulator